MGSEPKNVRGNVRKKMADEAKCLSALRFLGVADGTRTHDDQNHNLGLYQLSYSHR
jgi:hypothetical protein